MRLSLVYACNFLTSQRRLTKFLDDSTCIFAVPEAHVAFSRSSLRRTMAALVRSTLRLPFRLVRLVLLAAAGQAHRRTTLSLPVRIP